MFNQIKKHALAIANEKNIRDWGFSITIRSDISREDLKTYEYREKFLIFKPNKSIILESHQKHSEIWIADNDFTYALEDIDGNIKRYNAKKFERVFIRMGRKHKIINPNKIILSIFEIQTGDIMDNDKIQFVEEDKDV